jgi:hypothetical protein
MMHKIIGSTTILIWILTGAMPAMAIEEAKYNVVMKTDNFEVRHYASIIVAQTVVEGSLETAGSKAFRILFGYISGDNRSRQGIEMTTPVSQKADPQRIKMTAPVGQQQVQEDKWAVSFMMPAEYTMETLPVPENPKITLRRVPGRRMAAVRYSGSWSEKGYRENKAKLETWIKTNGLKIAGTPLWARYNAPFTPWFLRRNEILIPLAANGDQDG